MMLAHAKANLHEECLGYWRQLVCVDGIGDVEIKPETMQCALKSAVIAGQWHELEAILDIMQVSGHVIAPACSCVRCRLCSLFRSDVFYVRNCVACTRRFPPPPII